MCFGCVTVNRVLACVTNVDLVGDLALVVVWISLDVVCSSDSVEGVEFSL